MESATQLKAQVQKVCRQKDGPLFETLFLVDGSDLAQPEWSRDIKQAAVLDYATADQQAQKLGGHAVVVNIAPPAQTGAADPAREKRRQQRVAAYQRALERRKLF